MEKTKQELYKESIIALQKIDCNCNDCAHMGRNRDEYSQWDKLYTDANRKVSHPSHRIQYGWCELFGKPVSFIPNTCQIETQKCFVHRRDEKPPIVETTGGHQLYEKTCILYAESLV